GVVGAGEADDERHLVGHRQVGVGVEHGPQQRRARPAAAHEKREHLRGPGHAGRPLARRLAWRRTGASSRWRRTAATGPCSYHGWPSIRRSTRRTGGGAGRLWEGGPNASARAPVARG